MRNEENKTEMPKRSNRKPKVEMVEPILTKKNKLSKTGGILIGASITLVVVGLVLICFAVIVSYKDGNLFGINLGKKEDSTKLQLQYTQTSDNKIEGVYMIDVSEIVENVMPSIVAITSKTLVTSGMYGPSFFNQETYQTGAGSGIIVNKTETELLILTNNHVVEGTTSLSVQFIDGSNVDATIKGSSATRSL